MNNHTISGNLGRDAELRIAQSGTAVLSFSVPMKSGYGKREKVDWVNCAMFGKRAEGKLVEYMKKGTPVVVSGETYVDTYTDKEGVEKTSLAMNVSNVTLMGKRDAPQEPKQDGPPPSEQHLDNPEPAAALDDTIPF